MEKVVVDNEKVKISIDIPEIKITFRKIIIFIIKTILFLGICTTCILCMPDNIFFWCGPEIMIASLLILILYK